MAKKNDKTKRDYDKYSWANTMERIYSSKEHSHYLIGGLEGNAVKQGSNGQGLEAILKGTMASEQGKQTAIAYTQEQQEKEMKDLTVGEYITNYQSTIEKYFGKNNIPDIKEYAGEELTALKQKIASIMHDMSNPDKDKAKKAMEDYKKYEKINALLNIMEDDIYKNLISEAIERTNKYMAKEILLRDKKD